MATRTDGWTLFDLILVLGISAILAASAIPSASSMLARGKTTAAINRLAGAINLARQSAVDFNLVVTVCGLRHDNRCGADWAGRLSVFTDRDQNARLDAVDTLISHVEANNDTTVTWRSFGRKPYLQLTPFGYTNYQNGNFVVCPLSGSPAYARQIIVNIQGRVRLNHRRDNDGQPLDRRGRPLRC